MFENLKKVMDYWNSRPCNIRHSIKEVGTEEYFDEVERRKYFVEPHIPGFAEFKRWENKNVLEIGCGIGTDTVNFARAGAKKVMAVDLSEKSLEVAKKRASVFGLENISFKHANVEKLTDDVPDYNYDLIYSFGVLHHTPSPEKALEQIRLFMGEDTVLKIMMYYKFSWKVLWIILKYGKGAFWNADKLIAKYSEAQTGCPVTYAYTRNSIRTLLRSKGFKITDMFVDHIFSYSIPEYKNYKYKKVWYIRILPNRFFWWLETKMGWHLCVTAKLKM